MTDDGSAGRARPVLLAMLLTLVLSLLALVVHLRMQTGRTLDAAAQVEPGDTRAEVTRLLGPPDTWYSGGGFSGVCYGKFDTVVDSVSSQTNLLIQRQVTTDFDEWPVHIRFDSTGVVDRIKRGDDVVENDGG